MAISGSKPQHRSSLLVYSEAVLLLVVNVLTYLGVLQGGLLASQPPLVVVFNVGLVVVGLLLCFLSVGLYETKIREDFRGIMRRIIVASMLGLIAAKLFFLVFWLHNPLAETYVPIAFLINMLCVGAFRYLVHRTGLVDLGRRRILIYGAGDRASFIETRMRRRSDRIGLELLGYVVVAGDDSAAGVQHEPLLTFDDERQLKQFIIDQTVDEIVIACDQRRGNLPLDVFFELRLKGIEIIDLLDFIERETGQVSVDLLYPSWVLYSQGFQRQQGLTLVFDNLMNTVLAGLLFLMTAPIMFVTAIIIYLDDGRRTGASVLYKQVRVGKDGEPFEIMKFRSMRPDAEKDGAKWAAKNDNRVTRIGAFIRKYRIDELPQLINVLRGEMSFIGPRPERPQFVAELSKEIPYFEQRHHVKPGLAGWAQLNYPYGASNKDAFEKLKFDLYYVKHKTPLLDIIILIRTVEVVAFGKGR